MFDADVAEVRYDYFKSKRIAKLLQIENALTDKNAGKYHTIYEELYQKLSLVN